CRTPRGGSGTHRPAVPPYGNRPPATEHRRPRRLHPNYSWCRTPVCCIPPSSTLGLTLSSWSRWYGMLCQRLDLLGTFLAARNGPENEHTNKRNDYCRRDGGPRPIMPGIGPPAADENGQSGDHGPNPQTRIGPEDVRTDYLCLQLLPVGRLPF